MLVSEFPADFGSRGRGKYETDILTHNRPDDGQDLKVFWIDVDHKVEQAISDNPRRRILKSFFENTCENNRKPAKNNDKNGCFAKAQMVPCFSLS